MCVNGLMVRVTLLSGSNSNRNVRRSIKSNPRKVDAVLKSFLSDYPTIIGFVVINADGIPTKWHH